MNALSPPGGTTSWIWGEPAGRGEELFSRSPLDGSVLCSTRQLDEREISELLASLDSAFALSLDEVRAFAARLSSELEALSEPIFEALQRENAFTLADCREVRDAIVAFARDFFDQGFAPYLEPRAGRYAGENGPRQLRLVAVPWGTVAVVLPASAALLLGVTCLLNALATGNRVILRFPAACPLSAAILGRAIEGSGAPPQSVSVIMASAKTLLSALHEAKAPALIHYLGSSRHAAKLVAQGFEHGQSVIADGEGNTWVYVGPGADSSSTAELLTRGAVRYNGQTCTSINGALVHPALYAALREELVARWQALVVGDPRNEATDVGPLADADQARWCHERVHGSGGALLAGGVCQSNAFVPALVEEPDASSEFVTQGIFGPALWIGRANEDEFTARWNSNLFPLCAGIVQPDAEGLAWAGRLSNTARLVLNGDPSIEWMFEPWGGYPASGNNPVSGWASKYRRVVALDERPR